jgi:hypothetical protein
MPRQAVVAAMLGTERELEALRCVECGLESDVEAHAAGWVAFRVDLPDDPDPPEAVVYCSACAAREFG